MMSADDSGSWLATLGPDADVVLSARARMARNLNGFPFVGRASNAQRTEVLGVAKRAILGANLDETMLWVELNSATPRDRKLLVERHLISTNLAEGENPRGVAVSGDETLSIMVNEEDHLRMQVLMPGSLIGRAFERVNSADDALADRLEYAFSERFGYLTACPTNVGTGLRLSVMVHLPALRLTGEIDKVQRATRDLNLAVRGFFGEGSESLGDFYQVSNQITLGLTESNLLEEFQSQIVPRLVDYERAARRVLMERRTTLLDDRVYRALGVLRHARMLDEEETIKLLSRVRLGAHLKRFKDVDPAAIDPLFAKIQAAHLQSMAGALLDKNEMKVARADLVRKALS